MIQKNRLLLANIQMLRAFAAIAVVLHHAYPHYEAMGGSLPIVGAVSQWGFLGVDIFFVISGFIMAYTTFTKERTFDNATTFLKHRLFRIYLGYWPFFIMMLFALYWTNPQKLESLDIFGSLFLLNSNMFQLVLPISWSLSYELYFYILFVFTFLFPIRYLYVVIPLFIVSILSLVLYAFFNVEFPYSFFYSPFILEFFSGVLLYMYKEYIMKTWILFVSVVVIVIAYRYGMENELKNGLYRVSSFGVGALFIVLSALILEEKNLFHAGKFFEDLGNASYTLYLSHLIIIQVFYSSRLRGVFTVQSDITPLAALLFLLVICIAFSLIYYQKIEKPIYQKAIGYRKKL